MPEKNDNLAFENRTGSSVEDKSSFSLKRNLIFLASSFLQALVLALLPFTLSIRPPTEASAQTFDPGQVVVFEAGGKKLATVVSQPIVVSIPNDQDFIIGSEALTNFFDLLENGQRAIINKQKVKNFARALAKHIDKEPSHELTNDLTGETIQAGSNGRIINQEDLADEISQVLLGLANNPINANVLSQEIPFRRLKPGQAGKLIEIDIKRQTLSQWQDGLLLGEYRVSTGKRTAPTPLGEFKIANHIGRAYSRRYKLYMPYWMALTGPKGYQGYGIHELPEWSSGLKEGASHLGIRVSHGCIRLGVGPAELIYNWAENGTRVVIHK